MPQELAALRAMTVARSCAMRADVFRVMAGSMACMVMLSPIKCMRSRAMWRNRNVTADHCKYIPVLRRKKDVDRQPGRFLSLMPWREYLSAASEYVGLVKM